MIDSRSKRYDQQYSMMVVLSVIMNNGVTNTNHCSVMLNHSN